MKHASCATIHVDDINSSGVIYQLLDNKIIPVNSLKKCSFRAFTSSRAVLPVPHSAASSALTPETGRLLWCLWSRGLGHPSGTEGIPAPSEVTPSETAAAAGSTCCAWGSGSAAVTKGLRACVAAECRGPCRRGALFSLTSLLLFHAAPHSVAIT